MLPMLLAPLASSQRADPPTFSLQAPASCTGAAAGYTCTSSAVVTGYSPTGCSMECHVEYCFTKTLTDPTHAECSTWHEHIPSPLSLGTGLSDGPVTMYSKYRTVEGLTLSVPSQYAAVTITLIDTAPKR